jgi:hypothetical protein
MTDTSNRTATAGIALHLFGVGIVATVIIILFGGAVFAPLTGNKSLTEIRGDTNATEHKISELVTAIGHDAGLIPAEADPPGWVATKAAVPSGPQNPLSHPIEENTEAKADVAVAPQAAAAAVPESMPGPEAKDYATLMPVEEPPGSAATKMAVASEAQNPPSALIENAEGKADYAVAQQATATAIPEGAPAPETKDQPLTQTPTEQNHAILAASPIARKVNAVPFSSGSTAQVVDTAEKRAPLSRSFQSEHALGFGHDQSNTNSNMTAPEQLRIGHAYKLSAPRNQVFRYRVRRECGPISDPALRHDCIASFSVHYR